MDTAKVHHVLGLHNDMWAIEPGKLRSYLQTFVIGEASDDHEAKCCPRKVEYYSLDGALMQIEAASSNGQQNAAIAVIPLVGPITYRGSAFTSFFGGTSVQKWERSFRELVASPAVAGILIDTDSPGGSVAGVFELSKVVREARGQKPIAAIANTWAASAGYHIISQTGAISVSPSGEIGSVGVLSIHMDYSEALKQMGLKATIIKAGEFKVEMNPYEPLSEEALAEEQRAVDHYYEMFVDSVAKGRNTTAARVKADYGKGRMLRPQAAVDVGMADYVETFDQALKRLGGKIREQQRVAGDAASRKRMIEILETHYNIR